MKTRTFGLFVLAIAFILLAAPVMGLLSNTGATGEDTRATPTEQTDFIETRLDLMPLLGIQIGGDQLIRKVDGSYNTTYIADQDPAATFYHSALASPVNKIVIDWGDGTPDNVTVPPLIGAQPGGTYKHNYTWTGVFTITITAWVTGGAIDYYNVNTTEVAIWNHTLIGTIEIDDDQVDNSELSILDGDVVAVNATDAGDAWWQINNAQSDFYYEVGEGYRYKVWINNGANWILAKAVWGEVISTRAPPPTIPSPFQIYSPQPVYVELDKSMAQELDLVGTAYQHQYSLDLIPCDQNEQNLINHFQSWQKKYVDMHVVWNSDLAFYRAYFESGFDVSYPMSTVMDYNFNITVAEVAFMEDKVIPLLDMLNFTIPPSSEDYFQMDGYIWNYEGEVSVLSMDGLAGYYLLDDDDEAYEVNNISSLDLGLRIVIRNESTSSDRDQHRVKWLLDSDFSFNWNYSYTILAPKIAGEQWTIAEHDTPYFMWVNKTDTTLRYNAKEYIGPTPPSGDVEILLEAPPKPEPEPEPEPEPTPGVVEEEKTWREEIEDWWADWWLWVVGGTVGGVVLIGAGYAAIRSRRKK